MKEDENQELFVKISKPIASLKEISLYKDNTKLAHTKGVELSYENVKDDKGQEFALIKLKLNEPKVTDSGKYKLSYVDPARKKQPAESELASTNLIVQETQFEVLEPLKADKNEYSNGETIQLTFKLSKQLVEKDKCANWTLNSKKIDFKSKQVFF